MVELGDRHYLFIGWEIYEFTTPDPIIAFYSPVYQNDVPMPYAIGQQNTYLLNAERCFDTDRTKAPKRCVAYIPNHLRNHQKIPYEQLYRNASQQPQRSPLRTINTKHLLIGRDW